jgi:hypothetical protein
MGSALETLRTEAAVIVNAPWSFAICLAIATGIVWAVLNWRYGAIIDRLKDERDSLKDKLS